MGMLAERRRVAIVDGATRHDLSLPLEATLTDALAQLGIRPRPGREALLEPDGTEVSALLRAEAVREGAILSVVDLSPAPARRRAHRRQESVGTGTAGLWWVVAAAGVVLAVIAVAAPGALPDAARPWLAVCAGAAALGTAVPHILRARTDRPGATAVLAAALVPAFAAGALAAPPGLPGAEVLTVFAGLVSAAAAAGVLGLIARPPGLHAALTTATTVLLVLAGVWGGALLLGLPATGPAAVTVGLAPVGLRTLWATLMEVPPGLFIDYGRYQTTRWSVRQQLPEELHAITRADARRLVARSTGRLVSGTVALCTAAAAAIVIAVPDLDGSDPLVLAGRIALVATTVPALLLGARRYSSPLLRWLPRAAAAVILLVAVTVVVRLGDATTLTLAAAALLTVGAALAFTVVPAARGARSLFWSRTGDVIEWLTVALALPAALLAADTVDVLRGVMGA